MAERIAITLGPIIYVVSLLEPSYLFLCAWNIEHYECDLRIELTLTVLRQLGMKPSPYETYHFENRHMLLHMMHGTWF